MTEHIRLSSSGGAARAGCLTEQKMSNSKNLTHIMDVVVFFFFMNTIMLLKSSGPLKGGQTGRLGHRTVNPSMRVQMLWTETYYILFILYF